MRASTATAKMMISQAIKCRRGKVISLVNEALYKRYISRS